jgi:hypothetical protein
MENTPTLDVLRCLLVTYLATLRWTISILLMSDLNKKDRKKRHSSPFIIVVKGVFFVVRVTLVPTLHINIFILQSVHLLNKYAIRIIFYFIRTRRINFQFYRWRKPEYQEKTTDRRTTYSISKYNIHNNQNKQSSISMH